MRCFAKWIKTTSARALTWVWLALVGGLVIQVTIPQAQAQTTLQNNTPLTTGIAGTSVRLTPNSTGSEWDLQADFNVQLPSRVADLARSSPIYFVLDWRMSRPRWYWRDQRLAQGQLYWRLSHNPLTQQWRISSATSAAISDGRFAISYPTLNETLSSLRRIRRDGLVQSSELVANQKYELLVRLRLDTSQLPKPFQINAITNNDWALDSGVLEHVFMASAPVSAMVPQAPSAPTIQK